MFVALLDDPLRFLVDVLLGVLGVVPAAAHSVDAAVLAWQGEVAELL